MFPKLNELLSWNGPTVHVCCFILECASTKTFVSRIHIRYPSPNNSAKIFVSRNIRQQGHSIAEVSLYLRPAANRDTISQALKAHYNLSVVICAAANAILSYPAQFRLENVSWMLFQEGRSSNLRLRRTVGQATHARNNPRIKFTGVYCTQTVNNAVSSELYGVLLS